MGGTYYPQCSLILNVRWEDFGDTSNPSLKRVWTLPILAKRVTVNINDYRSADTFSAEVEFKNFPFDPRTIRSCAVGIYMEDMKRLENSDGSAVRIEPSRSNAIFLGFADEDSIKLDENSRVVTLEGRDYTSLLIDTPFSKGTVNLEQPVDVVISSILQELEATRQITLENRIDGDLPVIAAFSETKDGKTGRKNVKRGESYWDVIQDIVSRAGLIAYIELDRLVLSKPRVLYSKAKILPFIYGQNLTSLEFKRKLGRRKNFNIVVRGLVLSEKRVEEAKIPLEAKQDWCTATGILPKEVKLPEIAPDGTPIPEDKAKAAPYMAFLIPNVVSKDQLIEIGQQTYEEIGRQQIEGTFETKDMDLCIKSRSGSAEHLSLLELRNGTPVSIEIEQKDLEGMARLSSVEEKRRYLMARCYPPQLAEVFAKAMGKIATPFYTKAVEFTMDAESGFACKVEFLNFIEQTNRGFGTR